MPGSARLVRHPVALLGLFGLAAGIGAACGGPGGSGLTLTLLPDASCAGVPVGCVSHLDVALEGEAGPIDTTVPFTIDGGAAPLGDLPSQGSGSFSVAGVSTADATVFAGSSGTIAFTSHDQSVDVTVHCVAPPPCEEGVPKHFADQQPADLVLGQPGYRTCDPAAVAATTRLTEPRALTIADEELWVADTGDSRIAVYRGLATITTGAALAFNVGHTSLGGVAAGTSAIGLTRPHGVVALADRIIALDTGDNRGQVFVPAPSANGPTASFSLGQAAPAADVTANAGGLGAKSLSAPVSAVVLGTNLFVSDSGNARVLRYAISSLSSDAPKANLVLGAPSFTVTTNGTFSGGGLAQLATDGQRLYVGDTGFNRVLVWNSAAKLAVNDTPPSFAIGQPDLSTKTANSGGLSAHSLNQPRGVAASPARLVIADSSNHRVLIWEPPPASNVDATVVLGQADFTSNGANAGGAAVSCPTMIDCSPASPRSPTQTSLSRPGAAWLDGDAMWVSDTCNARVLRFTAH